MPVAEGQRRLVVGICVIGDEVLSGKVVEQNAAFLIARFRDLGVRVREVAVVPDERPAIVEAVARLESRADVVLTTGGIGPTHDDVTLAAMADLRQVAIIEHPAIAERLAAHMSGPAAEGYRRLARVPVGTELVWGAGVPWPALKHGKTWLLPGIPPLLQRVFEGIESHFRGSPPWFQAALELGVEESLVCEALDGIVAQHAQVQIGSYPRFEGAGWRLKLTFEGSDEVAVLAAREAARTAFEAYLAIAPHGERC